MLLEEVRLISLAVVESATRFREQLKAACYLASTEDKLVSVEHTPIVYRGENYLVKMKTDTSFLATSELAKWFNFSSKTDPFLIVPATPYLVAKGASK
jgi:hypothetical protein